MSWKNKIQLQACTPPAWARGGHAQTILGHLLPSKLHAPAFRLQSERSEITLPDGDRLVTHFLSGESGVVLYLFHGLGGNALAPYMLRTASVGVRLGHSVFMVNHRGCGEGQGLAAHPYHSGRAEDLSAVIANGRRLYPNKKHIAVGFSLSANALLFLLSGRRGDTWPDAAIAVNGPIHLESASFALGKGLNRIYDFRFSVECRREVQFREKKGLLPAGKYKFPLWTSLRDFDSLYTAPASGFSSREDYYSTCSTHSLLRHITVPTLLITAKDDPFIDYRNYLSAQLSPSVALHLEENGGHMGYLTNQPTVLGTHRWLDYALHEYLSAV